MKRYEWQHVARCYANGKVESEYLLANETDTDVMLEHVSIEDIKALRDTCDNIIRFDNIRSKAIEEEVPYGKSKD